MLTFAPPHHLLPSLRTLLLGGVLNAVLGVGLAAQAPTPLAMTQGQGRVEVLSDSNIWSPLTTGAPISTGLRTGTGRATLQAGERGQIIMGSASQLRRFEDEADLLRGRFLLRGPLGVHVQGNHVVMSGPGQARVDLLGATRRVAVLSGSVRVALGNKLYDVKAGEQFALTSTQTTPFAENDPWYSAQFRGLGAATVEATRGKVSLTLEGNTRNALVDDDLPPGALLNTDANAWAEIGFTGGGYLRLCESSTLSVVSIERTSRGREVLLKLDKGNAWNVVEKGQGGYRIDTPVVSTAVRGTVFRVDSSGLVKVFDGQVVTPSDNDQPISQGQQRDPGGQVGTLQLDDLDKFNMALDAQRARPLTLQLQRGSSDMPVLKLQAQSLPDARLSASIAGQTLAFIGNDDGQFTLLAPPNTIPDGLYHIQIRARRYGQTLLASQTVTLDHTPPTLTGLKVKRQGQVLILSGVAHDQFSPSVQLSVSLDGVGTSYTRFLTAQTETPFRWVLPNPAPSGPLGISLSVRDAAGNETHVALP